ncbi:hypothetical protein B0H17DRAFT_1257424 [Mycena rosella]|uniref:Uncharacterized protein n=1 Tax=Mycena rosella TaxID=1033263 RepID=A0AAD7G3Q9_MYCRO|nr:hypothetical protein B0H17DRAFT_1257424 [Mycena rosella]
MAIAGALAAPTAIISVLTAAKDIIELVQGVRETLQQVKQNRKDHKEQIEQILGLLDVVSTNCADLKPEQTGLFDAVNRLRSNLNCCLERCQDVKIPSGKWKGYWKSEPIKKTLEDIKVTVTEFLNDFGMGSNMRIERTISDNTDKLDELLALERNRASPAHPQSLNSGNQSPGSSRKTREFLLGKLHKLSKTLESNQVLTQRQYSPVYPDRLASNTHRPVLSDATNGLLAAITKTEHILQTYGIDSAADSAHSLDNLSVALMDVGLAAEASEISSFSVKIHGSINAREPSSNFAVALHNYSHHLSAFQKFNEAVGQARRAVDIYSSLHDRVFHPGRAKALDNLAACLYSVGMMKEALAASDEAVQISRDILRRKHDDEHLSADLAMFLSNRATRLASLRYYEDALKDASESHQMYRKLCQREHLSDRYTAEYADSLQVYSDLLSFRGRYKEALIPARKAVDLWRELSTINPDVYDPKLARGLLRVFDVLSGLSRLLEAQEDIRDALKIFRRLAGQSPDIYNHEYAQSLHRTARILMDQQRNEEALRLLADTLSLRGEWDTAFAAAVHDDKYICLTRLKRFAKAAEASRSAISLCEQTPGSQKRLAASRRELASALYNLSLQLKAIDPASEAVQLFRSLLAEAPDNIEVRRKLVMASRSLSLFYSDFGMREKALKYAKLSVKEGSDLGPAPADSRLLEQARSRLLYC